VKRRDFITFLGGAAALAAPHVARAQQPMRRVAVLMASREADPEDQARTRTLLQRLQQLGWVDGRNVRIDIRWAGGNAERTREIAAEFTALKPDVILSTGSIATATFKQATTSLPVVFTLVNEPVTQGFVKSLAQPGGNVTGFTLIDFTVIGKSVELLKTIAPALTRVGFIFNPVVYPLYDSYLQAYQTQPNRPVEVVRATATSPAEIDAVIDRLAGQPNAGLAVLADGGFNLAHRPTIGAAIERHRLPSISPWRNFAAEGSLMSYGPDTVDIFRRAADYIDRILKGAKPADLPVQQPVKFELTINAKTAKTLGLDVPPTLLAIADEVIE
jgi:putative tryptophan/tyrosine transport system substrate-binding protein